MILSTFSTFYRTIFNYSLHYSDLNQSVSTEDESQAFDAREEPDGEETIARSAQPQAPHSTQSPGVASNAHISDSVKVPNWILADTTLEVVFNERATQQIGEFHINRVSVPSSSPPLNVCNHS